MCTPQIAPTTGGQSGNLATCARPSLGRGHAGGSGYAEAAEGVASDLLRHLRHQRLRLLGVEPGQQRASRQPAGPTIVGGDRGTTDMRVDIWMRLT